MNAEIVGMEEAKSEESLLVDALFLLLLRHRRGRLEGQTSDRWDPELSAELDCLVALEERVTTR